MFNVRKDAANSWVWVCGYFSMDLRMNIVAFLKDEYYALDS